MNRAACSSIRRLASSISTAQFSQPVRYDPSEMPQTIGAMGSVAWTKVDVLTPYQRLSAEVQIRGRLRETVNDNEPRVLH